MSTTRTLLNPIILITILSTLIPSITSTPIIPTSLRPRGVPGAFYLCDLPHWGGACGWHPHDETTCYIGGHNSAKSIGPDEGGYCVLYKSTACDADKEIMRFGFPGKEVDVPQWDGLKCFKNWDGKVVPIPNVGGGK